VHKDIFSWWRSEPARLRIAPQRTARENARILTFGFIIGVLVAGLITVAVAVVTAGRNRLWREARRLPQLVLSGGGIRGVGHAAALRFLGTSRFKTVTGVSAGSLAGLALAVGFDGRSIIDILRHVLPLLVAARLSDVTMPRSVLTRKLRASSVRLRPPRRRRASFGDAPRTSQVHPRIFASFLKRETTDAPLGCLIRDIAGVLLLAGGHSPEATFRDLSRHDVSLRVVATNVSLGRIATFDNTLTPRARVADAIVASCSIPFVTRGVLAPAAPWQWGTTTSRRDCLFADGFLCDNAPDPHDPRALRLVIDSPLILPDVVPRSISDQTMSVSGLWWLGQSSASLAERVFRFVGTGGAYSKPSPSTSIHFSRFPSPPAMLKEALIERLVPRGSAASSGFSEFACPDSLFEESLRDHILECLLYASRVMLRVRRLSV
jgi:predicted acylesterase/phospholipase RssA